MGIRTGPKYNFKIVEGDSLSFYAWSRQTLGPPGLALGWTPLIHGNSLR